jgi:hypothetical protein
MPLQSGRSRSGRILRAASFEDLLEEFCGTIFEEEVTNLGVVQVDPICLHQTNDIIGVLHNPAWVTVRDHGVSFCQEELKPGLGGPGSDGLQRVHIDDEGYFEFPRACAAAMKPLNRGWGWWGLLRNSGWNWLATKKG